MTTKKEKIEKFYKFPCGPTDIDADGVCRKSLSEGMNRMMDRLTVEVNQELPPAAKLPKGITADESGKLMVEKEETPEERKAKLIEEGKLRAEVRHAVKQYQETLQGNSKLLQDITGKIESWHP